MGIKTKTISIYNHLKVKSLKKIDPRVCKRMDSSSLQTLTLKDKKRRIVKSGLMFYNTVPIFIDKSRKSRVIRTRHMSSSMTTISDISIQIGFIG
jgi:hypothetical protein